MVIRDLDDAIDALKTLSTYKDSRESVNTFLDKELDYVIDMVANAKTRISELEEEIEEIDAREAIESNTVSE